jgi:hypothetical protein
MYLLAQSVAAWHEVAQYAPTHAKPSWQSLSPEHGRGPHCPPLQLACAGSFGLLLVQSQEALQA